MIACMTTKSTPRRPGTYGRNLLKLLSERHMTQTALAVKSGVSRGTINALLSGASQTPDTETQRKLAAALGVRVSDFYAEEAAPAVSDIRQTEETHVSMPPGLLDFLGRHAIDITQREREELLRFSFRLKRGAEPGDAFWEKILSAIRSLPTE